MNFLDIILIIIIAIVFLIGVGFIIEELINKNYDSVIPALFVTIFIIGCCMLPFFVFDKHSGSTMGIVTSVDKNFFGTTALYIKTTETKEEEYCIEFDKKLENKAKKYIGKKVKITYGKRVGFYSTGKCSQSPVKTIELLDENK